MMRPSCRSPHDRQRDGDALRRGGEVAVDHQQRVFRRQLVPMPVVDVDPGIVEEDVEAADLVPDEIADPAHRGGARSGRRAGHGRCRRSSRIRAATSSSGASRRPVSTIAAPSRASASAAASPMPLPPPVTQTTLPSTRGTDPPPAPRRRFPEPTRLSRARQPVRRGFSSPRVRASADADRARNPGGSSHADDLADAAAAEREDAASGLSASADAVPELEVIAPETMEGAEQAIATRRRRLWHDPADAAGARRQTALAAGAAERRRPPGSTTRADRAPGRRHQFPRDLQRPYRRACHGLRAGLRARAARLSAAAAAPRVADDAARTRRRRAPARGDRAGRRRRRHRRRGGAARQRVRHDA
mgnify:CR=1 FL=1